MKKYFSGPEFGALSESVVQNWGKSDIKAQIIEKVDSKGEKSIIGKNFNVNFNFFQFYGLRYPYIQSFAEFHGTSSEQY